MKNGKFIFTGSDINGRQVRLRGSDGINVTAPAAARSRSTSRSRSRRFLAMRQLSALLLDRKPAGDFHAAGTGRYARRDHAHRPVAMTDPDLDGGSALLGEMPATAGLVRSPRDQLVIDGTLPEPPQAASTTSPGHAPIPEIQILRSRLTGR
jgi:hypothetical protein